MDIATIKSCGTCALCCKVLHVASLDKPPGRWCEHARKNAGCAIHGSHPDDCRAFACGWLQWSDLGEAWKPSTARFLIRPEPSQGRLCIDVDPGYPNAWKAAAYYPTLKAWARSIHTGESCLLVLVGERAVVVFPEEDIDIGPLRPEEELMVGYLKGKQTMRPLVRLLRDGEIAGEWRGAPVPRAA